jgi:hypothetical protein
LTAQHLVQVQNQIGLSNRGMNMLASTLNKVVPQRVVEKNFREKFESLGKQLSDLFVTSEITDTSKSTSQESKHLLVYCNDMEALRNTVAEVRGPQSDQLIKVGIDGGGGFVKVSFGIMSLETPDTSPPSKKPLFKNFKDSGVKRQLLVAIAENVSENYDNVKQILDKLCLERMSFVLSCDMKLANIICGLQSHSSAHPCTWCDIESKNLHHSGELRTFGSIRSDFEGFQAAGAQTKKARDFQNVVHQPIIRLSDDTLVLDFIPPMELHLLIGVVNHLFKNLCQVWQNADEWPKMINIQQQPFHGGQFAGNECRKLLRNVDSLQQLAEKHACFLAFPFIETLRKFDAVVHACFGNTLQQNYCELIEEFKASYLNLPNTSVTPKAHAVFFHVTQFIDRHNHSLGIFSEQATESLHHNFSLHWQRFKRPAIHPDYPRNLRNCLIEYNSKHLF